MIEAAKDSVFELENAVISPNPGKDTLNHFRIPAELYWNLSQHEDTTKMVIDKELHFNNVHFQITGREVAGEYTLYGILSSIVFTRSVVFENCGVLDLYYCVFESELTIHTEDLSSIVAYLPDGDGAPSGVRGISIKKCKFFSGFGLNYSREEELNGDIVRIQNNEFSFTRKRSVNTGNGEVREWPSSGWLETENIYILDFMDNQLSGKTFFQLGSYQVQQTSIYDNQFNNIFSRISVNTEYEETGFSMLDNTFNNYVHLELGDLKFNDNIGWKQFEGWLVAGLRQPKNPLLEMGIFGTPDGSEEFINIMKNYLDSARYVNPIAYDQELKLRSKLYNHYKSELAFERSNGVYVELKDIETNRLKYLYQENPTFDTFFKFKINQFLKIFSDYGTRPAKAIIVSIYVILLFALFYMFFPNTWDAQSRRRLIERYRFFFKYLNVNAGIHEVYLEGKQEDILEYKEFKKLIEASGQKVPRFFTATAKPIYHWAVSGTNLSARLLSRIDVIKGRWEELPKSKRIWKSMLVTGAFIIALIYDLFVKALNAIMLSVNTFTTLGFGEIPIKGVPRYLAIIQGFIGWFMLTIFSVSLISQLLN